MDPITPQPELVVQLRENWIPDENPDLFSVFQLEERGYERIRMICAQLVSEGLARCLAYDQPEDAP